MVIKHFQRLLSSLSYSTTRLNFLSNSLLPNDLKFMVQYSLSSSGTSTNRNSCS